MKRRGVGTLVVGVVILLVVTLLTGSFVIIVARLDDVRQASEESTKSEWERQQELFYVDEAQSSVTGDNRLNLTVVNIGSLEVTLVYVGIFNLTAGQYTYLALGDTIVNQGESLPGVLSPQPLSPNYVNQSLQIQLLSRRGSVGTVLLINGSFVQPQQGGEGGGGSGFAFPQNLILDSTSNVHSVETAARQMLIWVNATNLGTADMTNITFTLTWTENPDACWQVTFSTTVQVVSLIPEGETVGVEFDGTVDPVPPKCTQSSYIFFTVVASGVGVISTPTFVTVGQTG